MKIERFLLITRDGGSIVINPSKTLYLLVPAKIARQLENDFNLNLRKDKTIQKFCSVALENEGEKQVIRVIYEFKRSPTVKQEKKK